MLMLALPLLFACDEQNEGASDLDDSPSVGFISIGKFNLSNLNASQQNIFVPPRNVKVSAKASDDGSVEQVTLFLDGTQVGSISEPIGSSYTFDVDFPNSGEATLELEATDNDGNKSVRVSQKVTVDSQKPSLNVVLLVNSSEVDISQPPLPPVDRDDSVTIIATPSDDFSDVNDITVELRIAGVVINNTGTNNLGRQVYPLNQIVNFDSANVIDINLKAIDESGNESDPINFSIIVRVRTDEPDLELPTVSIDTANIEPGTINSPNCTLAACYEGTISVPIRVEDETGTAKVTLVVESEALGKAPVSTLTSFPFVGVINTLEYPNNDKLVLVAQVVSDAGVGASSTPVTIEVFNEAPPAVLSINSPADGDSVSGILPVSVTINQLTDSEYTLDLNGDSVVDASVAGAEQEGIHIELIDFTGEIVGEERLSDATLGRSLSPIRGGSYETLEGFDTNELANDTYTLRVTVNGRLHSSPNNQVDLTLVRKIEVDTDNTSRVPPALLILDPTNPNDEERTIRSSVNAYVTAQATDNTGLAFVELRVFTGEVDDDSTPSRYVYASPGEVFTVVSLPINFNADPYLVNGNDYKVRVVAEDVDGNRTFQDIRINLMRSSFANPTDPGYQLRRTGPLVNTADLLVDDRPCIQIKSPIIVNEEYSIQLALDFRRIDIADNCVGIGQVDAFPPIEIAESVNANDRFSHFVKRAGEVVYRPIITIGTSGTGFIDGYPNQGTYRYLTQIVTEDGDIYISNEVAVAVQKPTNQQ